MDGSLVILGRIVVANPAKKTEPGVIRLAFCYLQYLTPAKIWGIQATTFRVISIVILVIGLALLALLFLVPAKKVDETAVSKQKALDTEQKHKNLIITVNKLPELGLGESILTVDSLDELIKVAQALMKPINHFVNEITDIYWITDARTRYEYLVVGESSIISEGNKVS